MGGAGSGLWRRADAKGIVENCLHLDITEFIRTGNLVLGKRGIATWSSVGLSSSRQQASFEFSSDQSGTVALNLNFALTGFGDVHQRIPIRHVRQSDERTYARFACPLNVAGAMCNRLVRKLYMNQCRVGCRCCHDLRYFSTQDAHKEERLRRKLLGLTW